MPKIGIGKHSAQRIRDISEQFLLQVGTVDLDPRLLPCVIDAAARNMAIARRVMPRPEAFLQNSPSQTSELSLITVWWQLCTLSSRERLRGF